MPAAPFVPNALKHNAPRSPLSTQSQLIMLLGNHLSPLSLNVSLFRNSCFHPAASLFRMALVAIGITRSPIRRIALAADSLSALPHEFLPYKSSHSLSLFPWY